MECSITLSCDQDVVEKAPVWAYLKIDANSSAEFWFKWGLPRKHASEQPCGDIVLENEAATSSVLGWGDPTCHSGRRAVIPDGDRLAGLTSRSSHFRRYHGTDTGALVLSADWRPNFASAIAELPDQLEQ